MLAAQKIHWSKPKSFVLCNMEPKSWGNTFFSKKFKALCADVPLQSSLSWNHSKLQELNQFKAPRAGKAALPFFPTFNLPLVPCAIRVLTIGEDPGLHVRVAVHKVWISSPPLDHSLTCIPIHCLVLGNEVEGFGLPLAASSSIGCHRWQVWSELTYQMVNLGPVLVAVGNSQSGDLLLLVKTWLLEVAWVLVLLWLLVVVVWWALLV